MATRGMGYARESVEWCLNPPYSPTWTRACGKHSQVDQEGVAEIFTKGPIIQALSPDEFYTQLKRAQGYINARPLLRPESQLPLLTPGDFIGTGTSQLVNITWRPEFGGSLGYRYQTVRTNTGRSMEAIQRVICGDVEETEFTSLWALGNNQKWGT